MYFQPTPKKWKEARSASGDWGGVWKGWNGVFTNWVVLTEVTQCQGVNPPCRPPTVCNRTLWKSRKKAKAHSERGPRKGEGGFLRRFAAAALLCNHAFQGHAHRDQAITPEGASASLGVRCRGIKRCQARPGWVCVTTK